MAIGCSSVTPAHAEPIQRSTTFLEGRKYHNRDQVAYLLPDDNEGIMMHFWLHTTD